VEIVIFTSLNIVKVLGLMTSISIW